MVTSTQSSRDHAVVAEAFLQHSEILTKFDVTLHKQIQNVAELMKKVALLLEISEAEVTKRFRMGFPEHSLDSLPAMSKVVHEVRQDCLNM